MHTLFILRNNLKEYDRLQIDKITQYEKNLEILICTLHMTDYIENISRLVYMYHNISTDGYFQIWEENLTVLFTQSKWLEIKNCCFRLQCNS